MLVAKQPNYDHFDAPVAVRQLNPKFGTMSTGMFSSADLLTETKLAVGSDARLAVNLNHAVTKIETNGAQVTAVTAHDLIANKIRKFKAKHVVLAAGTVESAKLAKVSGLPNPNGKLGIGLTDHPIYFTHFAIPQGKPWHRAETCSKTLSRHKQASTTTHTYNMVLELGADLNQGRYLDLDALEKHRQLKGEAMFCEIVFLFNAPLLDQNKLDHFGPHYAKPEVTVAKSAAANTQWDEINALKNQIVANFDGVTIAGENLDLHEAPLGGVAHEVGTLRLGAGGCVDENLKYFGCNNLFVCDLSVFPSSPAANPTLTLAALALRLAEHLKALV